MILTISAQQMGVNLSNDLDAVLGKTDDIDSRLFSGIRSPGQTERFVDGGLMRFVEGSAFLLRRLVTRKKGLLGNSSKNFFSVSCWCRPLLFFVLL